VHFTGSWLLRKNAGVYSQRNEPGLAAAVDRYVTAGDGIVRRYLKLLHGNFAGMEHASRDTFLRSLADDARHITDHELKLLLDYGWRARLTAAWLISIVRREQFRPELNRLLLASETVYAGQGYCIALARFGTGTDADALVAYLDRYLNARPRLDYDQPWALGALLHIDERTGPDRASQFLGTNGPWYEWSEGRWDATSAKKRTDQLCDLIDQGRHIDDGQA
jgi:hypothetical protein